MPSGTWKPSRTTAPAATSASAPITEPPRSTAPIPISAPVPMRTPCSTQRCPIVTSSPITLGAPGSAWIMVRSWTFERFPIVSGASSPRTTQPNQTPASSPNVTSPVTIAFLALYAPPGSGSKRPRCGKDVMARVLHAARAVREQTDGELDRVVERVGAPRDEQAARAQLQPAQEETEEEEHRQRRGPVQEGEDGRAQHEPGVRPAYLTQDGLQETPEEELLEQGSQEHRDPRREREVPPLEREEQLEDLLLFLPAHRAADVQPGRPHSGGDDQPRDEDERRRQEGPRRGPGGEPETRERLRTPRGAQQGHARGRAQNDLVEHEGPQDAGPGRE